MGDKGSEWECKLGWRAKVGDERANPVVLVIGAGIGGRSHSVALSQLFSEMGFYGLEWVVANVIAMESKAEKFCHHRRQWVWCLRGTLLLLQSLKPLYEGAVVLIAWSLGW